MSADDFAPAPNTAPATENAPQDGKQDSIALAPFFRDPRFQQYYRETADAFQRLCREHADALAALETLREIFTTGRYSIKDPNVLRNVHEDAFLLYDVVNGKRSIIDLLAAFESVVPPEIFSAMLVDIHRFMQPRLVALTLALPPQSEKSQ